MIHTNEPEEKIPVRLEYYDYLATVICCKTGATELFVDFVLQLLDKE